MQEIELQLFGVYREYQADGVIRLSLPKPAYVADLRAALAAYAEAHWPSFRPGLLAVSAFASEHSLLRDADPLPDIGGMAVLPPVSGG